MSASENSGFEAIEQALARSERHVRTAARTQQAVQYVFLSAGIALIVGLFAASPSTTPNPGTISVEVKPIEVQPIQVSLKDLKLPERIPVDVKIEDISPITFGPLTIDNVDLKPELNVEIAGRNLQINGISPGARDWHRTVFDKVDDQFWALPVLDFALTLEDFGSSGGCSKRNDEQGKRCSASFEFKSNTFLGAVTPIPKAVVLDGKNISKSALLVNDSPAECKTLDFPYIPVLLCKLKNNDTTKDNACLWIRRSEHPEQPNQTQVALDVKWERIPQGEQCRQWND